MRSVRIQDKERIDLPREKFKKYGADRVSDEELLALLLGSGTQGKNVLSLAKEIMRKIRKIGADTVTIDDLKEIRGLGEVKSQQIIALLAFAKRMRTESKKSMVTGKDVWKLCSDFYESGQENLAVFYLDTRSHLIQRDIVFVGTLKRECRPSAGYF